MTPFPLHRLTFVYRPGSGKVLVNLLRFSSAKIPLVFLQQCTISAEERCRYLALDPHLVFTTKQDEALATSCDAILWAREVFETEQDFLCWRELMEQAIAHRKNIYNLARLNLIATDPDLSRLASQNQIKYWEASTAANEIAQRPTYGQIVPKRPKAKVVLMLGTERCCGKFTTTQILKQRLHSQGLKVAELATEPYGLLTGADAVIIPQMLPLWQATPAIHQIISELEDTLHPDILLVSSQSGLRSKGLDAYGRCGGIIAYSIALGSLPDACILCSPLRTVDSIKKEKDLLESLLGANVLGISIKERDRPLATDSFAAVQHAFDLPVFDPWQEPERLDEVIESILALAK
jgi:uncharacterized NAD-dependent epimerase/dehydratase family protein